MTLSMTVLQKRNEYFQKLMFFNIKETNTYKNQTSFGVDFQYIFYMICTLKENTFGSKKASEMLGISDF